MRHGSLFNGIGGFQLAAHWLGWENVWHCEIDKFCNKVVKQHFPNSICYEDIKQFDAREWKGRIDIISGGFPCQPFSQAGKRKGTEDNRYLWPQMLRIIREVQPCYVVGENVGGLINWDRGLVFEQVQADLEAEGYESQAYVLPACAKNAPHRRDRVWFIAHSMFVGLEGKIQKNGSSTELYKRRKPSAFDRDFNWDGFDLQRSDEHLRRDNGVSNWVHRVKALGNAIVPQVAFEIFKAIESIAE